jgi:hypothetical protein
MGFLPFLLAKEEKEAKRRTANGAEGYCSE